MNAPIAMASDSVHHRLFVADQGNRVLVFNTASITNEMAASNVLGQLDFDSTTAATTQSGMSQPHGMAYDPIHDRLFVADANNSRVLVFNTSSISNGMNASHVLGQPNFTSHASATTQSGMANPWGVVYDSVLDRLFVAELGNNRVLVFNTSSISDGMNASNVLGQLNFTSHVAATTQSEMNFPVACAYDTANNRLFVVSAADNRVLVFNTASINNGMNASNVLGQTNFTSKNSATTPSGLNQPSGVDYDSVNNRLFVADGMNSRILIFNAATLTNGMNASNVLGEPDFTSVNFATTQSGMSLPWGVAADPADHLLFVADSANNRVLLFDTSTITNGMNASNVLGQPDFTTLPSGVGAFTMKNPIATAVDAVHHRLFVADETNDRVLVFNTGSIADGMSASYVLGQPDFNSSTPATTQAGMSQPWGLAYDSVHDRLFVSDSSNSNGGGNNNRVLVFNTSSITNGMKASYVLGQPNFTSANAATTQSGMSSPFGVAYDPTQDRLFVAELSNNRILIFDTSTLTNGMKATHVLGQANFISNTGGISQSGINLPRGCAFDSNHNRLFVVDVGNRVLVFNTAAISDGMNASNVLGQPNFTSHAVATTQSGLSGPVGASYDFTNDRLFVADVTNNRVLVFNASLINNGMNALVVLGEPDFTSVSNNAVTQSGLSVPWGVTSDPDDNLLFVSDLGNNRILIFDICPAPVTPPVITSSLSASGGIGTAFNYDIIATNNPTSFNAVHLPTGLSVDTTSGIISGVPTESGNFSVTLNASNAGGTGTATLGLTIFSALSITTPSPLPDGMVGNVYAQTFSAVAGKIPYVWSVSSGNLPNGIALDSTTGIIGGTPVTGGSTGFIITVTDANNVTAAKSFTLMIDAAKSSPPPQDSSHPATQGIIKDGKPVCVASEGNVLIINRQGKKVTTLESDGSQVCWDGKSVSSGTYGLMQNGNLIGKVTVVH